MTRAAPIHAKAAITMAIASSVNTSTMLARDDQNEQSRHSHPNISYQFSRTVSIQPP